jgi:hypothetical protein
VSLVGDKLATDIPEAESRGEDAEGLTESLKIACGFTLFFMTAFTVYKCRPLKKILFRMGKELLRPVWKPALVRTGLSVKLSRRTTYWTEASTDGARVPIEPGVPGVQKLQAVTAEVTQAAHGHDTQRRLALLKRRDEWGDATRHLELHVELQMDAWRSQQLDDEEAAAARKNPTLQPLMWL